MQLVVPNTLYDPLEHQTQAVDGSASMSASPAGHSEQSLAPVDANVPGAHSVHGVEGLVSSSAVPDKQSEHITEPTTAY